MSDEQSYRTALVTEDLPPDQVERIRANFDVVHYHPDPVNHIPQDALESADIMLAGMTGIPTCVESITSLPRLKLLQITCTGLDKALRAPAIVNARPDELEFIKFANSSGGYVLCMPNFIINYITALYSFIPSQIYLQRSEKRWVGGEGVMRDLGWTGIYGAKAIYGKTIGFLGYGSLGREFARMCSIFPKVRLLAANSDGKRKADDCYTVEGTGDPEAKLPEKIYSSKDPASLKVFISECDVLVCSLPGTRFTAGLLDVEKLSWIKPQGVFINVGRGTLIKPDHILEALNRPNGLLGAAIDVSDPEPLPDNHPLYSHPRAIITPHLSGEPENQLEMSTTIFLENVRRLRSGESICNSASFDTGY